MQIFDVLNESSELLLNPADFVIPRKERCRVEGFVLAMNKASSDLSFAFKGHMTNDFDFPIFRRENVYKNVIKPTKATAEKIPTSGKSRSVAVVPVDSKLDATDSSEKISYESNVPESAVGDDLELKQAQLHQMRRVSRFKAKQIHEQRKKTQSAKEAIQETEHFHFRRCYYVRKESVSIREAVIQTSVSSEIPSMRDHLIIICKVFTNLHDLIRPLRARYLGECPYIVILYPYDVTEDMWAPLSMFESVAVVKGSALEEVHLKRAGIYRANKVLNIVTIHERFESIVFFWFVRLSPCRMVPLKAVAVRTTRMATLIAMHPPKMPSWMQTRYSSTSA